MEPRNTVHTFGDSHAQFGFNQIRGVAHHNIGPKLCFSFGRHSLTVLDLKQYVEVKENDTVIFAFGEIDCRCHIKRQCVDGVSYQTVIDNITNNYMHAIDANIRQYSSLRACVLSITPTVVKNQNAENPEYPYVGSDDERKCYVKYFNKTLLEKCAKQNYTFIDVHDAYADCNGFLKKELSDGNVHIQNPVYLITALKFYNII